MSPTAERNSDNLKERGDEMKANVEALNTLNSKEETKLGEKVKNIVTSFLSKKTEELSVKEKLEQSSMNLEKEKNQMHTLEENLQKIQSNKARSYAQRQEIIKEADSYVTKTQDNLEELKSQKDAIKSKKENLEDTMTKAKEPIEEINKNIKDEVLRTTINSYIGAPSQSNITQKNLKEMIKNDKDLTQEQKDVLTTSINIINKSQELMAKYDTEQAEIEIEVINAEKLKQEASDLSNQMQTRYDTERNLVEKKGRALGLVEGKDGTFNYYGRILSKEQTKNENGVYDEEVLTGWQNNQQQSLETKMAQLLNGNQKPDVAKNFFEKGDENEYNYIIDQISAKTKGGEIKFEQEDKDPMVGNFYQFLLAYTGQGKEDIAIKDVKIVDNDDNYKEAYRLVSLTKITSDNPEGIKKIVSRGSQEHMQTMKSESKNAAILLAKDSKDINISDFDGKGNYMTFKKYIEKHPEYVTVNNLFQIVDAIKRYTPGKDTTDAEEDLEGGLRNGYANVLTNHILTHTDLMPAYITYLRPENINMLGVDTETQNANLNKITSSVAFKKEQLDDTQINSIKSLTEVINGQAKGKLEVAMNKGIDSVIKMFGKDFVIGLLEMFGGKGFLKKFCGWFKLDYEKTFSSINKLYKDKYGLSSDQKDILKKAMEDLKNKDGNDKIKGTKGENISYNREEINKYYRTTLATEKGIKHLDAGLILKALQDMGVNNDGFVYKDSKGEYQTDIKILNDKIKRTETWAKIKDKNKDIVPDPNDIFGAIYARITSSKNKIWDKIQEAGNIVGRTDTIYNIGDKNMSDVDREENMQKRQQQGITSAADVAVYFGAYLMKGSENVAYVRSENLIEGEEDKPVPTIENVIAKSKETTTKEVEQNSESASLQKTKEIKSSAKKETKI